MRLPSFLKLFDAANLRLRVISALILVPVALCAVWFGGIIYAAFITAAVTVGLYEWLRLIEPAARPKIVITACAAMIASMAGGFFFSSALGAMLAVLATFILFLLSVRKHEAHAGWMALGIPYMGGSGLALLALRDMPAIGAGLVFYLLLSVWGTDVGAFVAGRIIGGAKLAPSISPSKTWAGLFGGMVLATLLGYLAAWAMGARLPVTALVLSPLLAVVAQIGDLFESYFKRRSGVKESGALIPGHGGVLDRIDGLAFAGVFAFLFEKAIGLQIDWW